MTDLTTLAKTHADLPEDAQKKAGQAIGGDMDEEHTEFLKTVIALLDSGEITTSNPESLLNKAIYDSLEEEWKSKVDVALVNIVDQLRHIEEFYRSKETPNSSPQLQTMIEHLWRMKQKIEKTYDMFKF